MTVTEIAKRLVLRRIAAPTTIRSGTYPVSVGAEWCELDAVEPRIHTGGAPIRELQLQGSGTAASHLARLEAELRKNGGPLRMKSADQVIDVTFDGLRSTLYLYGDLTGEGEGTDLTFRISIGGKTIEVDGIDGLRDGRRTLVLTDVSAEDEAELLRAVEGRQPIEVEIL